MSHDDPPASQLPDCSEVAEALSAAGAAVDPCELHGSLCGYIAGGGRADTDGWLQRLQVDAERAPSAGDALDALHAATLEQFEAQDFGFQLLLPSDDEPLADRVDALVAWCRGYLGGFGLAAPPPGVFSGESTEALADIGRIAASDLGCDDSESDEQALAELIEYVRVAALLMHGDCAKGAQRRRKAN